MRPCLIHTCPCHALTVPFFSRPWHSTAFERRPVGYLPTFGFFRLPCGVPWILLSEAYQSSSQRSVPMTVKSGSSTLQKRRSGKLLDQQFGYFRLPRGLSRRTRHCRSRAGAQHGICELTNGMAGERHGHSMLCVNRPFRGTLWAAWPVRYLYHTVTVCFVLAHTIIHISEYVSLLLPTGFPAYFNHFANTIWMYMQGPS